MIIRQGFFDGQILAGSEPAFFAFVAEKMLPIWSSFPGLIDLRVSSASCPEDGVDYPLHTAFTFASEEALIVALNSPERQESVTRTERLLEMFDGRVFHIVLRPLAYAGRTIKPGTAA